MSRSKKKSIVNYSFFELISDIAQLIKPYKFQFWLASFIRAFGDLAFLYPAYALSYIVTFLTEYKPGQDISKLYIVISLWLIAMLIRSLSQYYAKSIGYRLAEKLSIDSTLITIQHLFKLDMIWHEKENSGNKLKRIQNAGEGFNNILRIWFNSIIEISINLIAINIIIWQFDQKVIYYLIFFLITYFFISNIMTKKARDAAYQVSEQEENISGLIFEAVNNIRTVKVMAIAKVLLLTIKTSTDELFKRIKNRVFWYQSRNGILTFWASLFKVLVIIIIIYGILNGQYQVGFLILFNSYFSDLRASIDELATASVDFEIAKMSIARMKNILAEPINIDDENNKLDFPLNWKKIHFKDVSFAYEGNNILKKVSFEVTRGEKIGLVGSSGAGKSTLFKLLLKERDEFTGDILFDDLSIKKIKKGSYFEALSVVLQDTEVFNQSLLDNISITNYKEKANQKLLQQAVSIAYIDDLVQKLPKGLNTIIGEKGIKLSGGERQRLGIARAIFKQPEILLLDEATSHLDLESESKIKDSLHQFFGKVTAFVIAHRLTTIRAMDKILFIENGEIVENGSFDDLIKLKGRFYQMWNNQGV